MLEVEKCLPMCYKVRLARMGMSVPTSVPICLPGRFPAWCMILFIPTTCRLAIWSWTNPSIGSTLRATVPVLILLLILKDALLGLQLCQSSSTNSQGVHAALFGTEAQMPNVHASCARRRGGHEAIDGPESHGPIFGPNVPARGPSHGCGGSQPPQGA